MPYMYILECADGSYYTGSTKDLDRRLWEHQTGLGANHTAKRLPVRLVYCEEFDRVDDAFYREKQVQGWSRKKKEALMVSDMNQLHMLAECKNESHCGGSTSITDRYRASSLSRRVSGVELGVEGNNAEADNVARSLSGVETSTEGIVD